MGDMADWVTDNGLEAMWEHDSGQCDGPCQLCLEEEARRQRKRKKPRQKPDGSPNA